MGPSTRSSRAGRSCRSLRWQLHEARKRTSRGAPPKGRGTEARHRGKFLGLPEKAGNPEDVTAMGARIWGLSKRAANYRPAPKPEVRCDACKYMFPALALGGCRLVRGVIQGS